MLDTFSLVKVVFMTADSFLECARKKKKKKKKKKRNQFVFRLGLNAIKQLWCSTDMKMFSAFFSMVHSHSKNFVFSIDSFVLCYHKVLSLIAITVPVH